jgi:hypothetical protein
MGGAQNVFARAVARRLLQAGADPGAKDRWGRTPLDLYDRQRKTRTGLDDSQVLRGLLLEDETVPTYVLSVNTFVADPLALYGYEAVSQPSGE